MEGRTVAQRNKGDLESENKMEMKEIRKKVQWNKDLYKKHCVTHRMARREDGRTT